MNVLSYLQAWLIRTKIFSEAKSFSMFGNVFLTFVTNIIDGLVRVSVGLEHVDNIIQDLEQALN